MDPRIADFIRYTLLIIALLVASLFAHKHYRRHVAKKEIVAELQVLTSDSSFYRQFEIEDAEGVLLRCVALVHQAKELGLPPADLFDRVFQREDEFGEVPSTDFPIKEELVRNTLTAAYDAANRLEMLDDASIRDLMDGRIPIAVGSPVILPLIDPELSSGVEKIIPNLEILPADRAEGDRELTTVETAAARRLAKDLSSAGVIENTLADRIVQHYKTPQKEDKKE